MIKESCAVALGFFDGVHIAHQKIIKSAVSYAQKNSLSPVALSFDISPLEILAPEKVKYLTTQKQKAALIEELGARAEFLPLSRKLLSMEPEDFISDILIKEYHIKYVVCGYNYRFGKNGRGDTSMLQEFGRRYDFTVEICECEMLHGESVSSSRIRELISKGDIHGANELLGRSFFITGTVCEGKKLGRTLGFPTANVMPDDLTAIPRNGVYKTLVTIDKKSFTAITNTGVNPTVGGERLRCETYIPSFNADLYGQEMKIEFLDFIRPEKKFESIEKLKEQIEKDLEILQ